MSTVTRSTDLQADTTGAGKKVRRRNLRSIISMAILIVLIGVILGLSTNFIPSESMLPTLKPGDHILTMRAWLAYPAGMMPSRGDIIVFRVPYDQVVDMPNVDQMATEPADEDTTGNGDTKPAGGKKPGYIILIKRVIGLPGDSVLMRGNTVTINGKNLVEDYPTIPEDDPGDSGARFAVNTPLVVPTGELFVLGDNRGISDDGRFWGTLKRKNIIGRFIRVLYHEGANGPNEKRAQQSSP